MNTEYKTSLTKIIQRAGVSTLFHRTFEDIKKEEWGVFSLRPLVYLSDAHEAIEKSMWCYLNNMVPLIGEKDPELTARLASLYQVDSLITDATSLKFLSSYLSSRLEPLVAISLLGTDFEPMELMLYVRYTKRFRLVQTDTGGRAIAEAELQAKPVFKVLM